MGDAVKALSTTSNCCDVFHVFVWNTDGIDCRHMCVQRHTLLCSLPIVRSRRLLFTESFCFCKPASHERSRQRRLEREFSREYDVSLELFY